MAHLYYVPAGEPLEAGAPARLLGDQARHAASVARLSVGESVLIGDGAGTLGHATATAVSPQGVELMVHSTDFHPKPESEVWLVQALAKGDRDELAIQTCTELGVDRIIPWQAARSVPVWKGEKADKGVLRWQKIASEAAKQSLRPWIPVVEPILTTAELAAMEGDHQLVLLDPEAIDSVPEYIPPRGRPILVIVGPEGGVEPAEREVLLDAGAVDLRLGTTILRTSSAGPAALALLNSSMGRW